MSHCREYALYKGDKFLSVGTIAEIAKEMGMKKKTILYYKTPTYLKRKNRRMELIELEDDYEENN